MPSARFKWVVAFMSVLTVATYLVEPFVAARPAEDLRAAPDFALATIDGSTFRLSEHNGSLVLIDFMATWCPPCRETVVELARVRASWPVASVAILSVDIDYSETPQQLAAFRHDVVGANGSTEAQGWYFAMDAAGEFVGPMYGANALPTLVLVDGDGKIRHSWIGVTRAAEIEAAMAAASV